MSDKKGRGIALDTDTQVKEKKTDLGNRIFDRWSKALRIGHQGSEENEDLDRSLEERFSRR